MNWFERHLNWTVILATLASYLVAFILAFLFGVMFWYLPGEDLEAIGGLIGFTVPVVPVSIVLGWALRQKQRRLWWILLWWLVPFGWIFVLTLENRSEMRLK